MFILTSIEGAMDRFRPLIIYPYLLYMEINQWCEIIFIYIFYISSRNCIYKTNVSVLKINCTNPKLTELSLLLASLVLDMLDVLCGDWRSGGYNEMEKNTGQFFIRLQTGVRLARDLFLSDKMFTSHQDHVVLRSPYKIIRFQSKQRLKAHLL